MARGDLGGITLIRASDGMGVAHGEASCYSLCYSTNGAYLLAGGDDARAVLLRTDVHPMELIRQFIGHSYSIYSVAFCPDNMLVGTGSSDGTSRLWRADDGTNLFVLNSGSTRAVKFSRDGGLFITAGDGIRFWRVSDSRLVAHYDEETSSAVSLDVSRNNRYFAYGRDDGVLVFARMPLYMSEISRSADQLILRWQGGTGRYQLQQRPYLTTGDWQNVGEPTANTSFGATLGGGTIFYRVRSLPTP